MLPSPSLQNGSACPLVSILSLAARLKAMLYGAKNRSVEGGFNHLVWLRSSKRIDGERRVKSRLSVPPSITLIGNTPRSGDICPVAKPG
jgi:hypothetical protein